MNSNFNSYFNPTLAAVGAAISKVCNSKLLKNSSTSPGGSENLGGLRGSGGAEDLKGQPLGIDTK